MTDKGKPLATRNGLKVYSRLKSRTPLKSTKRLNKTSPAIARRNKKWHGIVLARADYLIKKYGHLICEYSGETIRVLSSVPNDVNEGWGHHINHRRNRCVPENCYITKYKYHQIIEDNNIRVKQEGFEGKE